MTGEVDKMDIANKVRQVLGKINGRAKVVAASKYVDAAEITELAANGIMAMGENRVDALLGKKGRVPVGVEWHFIGSLQSRKVKEAINEISCLHSLDRLSLAKEIEKHRQEPLDCLVQVNVSGEASKQGITPEELPGFLSALAGYPKIRVTGLMTMAPNTDDKEAVRACFAGLRKLRDVANAQGFSQLKELSMGMSNDYLIAIEEGATIVRLGSVLFED